MTATNRIRHGTEFLFRFRESQPSDPEQEKGWFQVYDWSCVPQNPCENGYPGGSGANAFVRSWRLDDVPCWYKMLEDNTGHFVNWTYYRNSSWILEPRNPPDDPPLWRNAVSILNFCTGQYDGIYSHDYAINQNDCSFTCMSASWAGIAERFYDGSQKPPVVAKQGFSQMNLEYDGQSTRLRPENSTFRDPSSYESPFWQLYSLWQHDTWEAGTYQDDDGDDIPNSSDPDIDGDGAPNAIEGPCGVTVPPHTPPQQPEWHPYRAPERIDGAFSGTDDDGDTLVDDLLPSSADPVDCDLDGFVGDVERYVFSRGTTEDDQAACGETVTPPGDEDDDRWPADFDDNRNINVSDVLALKPWIGTFVPPTSPRFDIVPSGSINISDVLAVKAVFGRVCSTPPAGG